ncbi:unnamed protein product [Oppiella nova]|uniref:Chitin-binding type-4 domain-containing protein n=1 Tax=Oppiella nova TaxID=334625 RepID=A0A7R9QUV5_9ACAR|nr:unnamed protein product [Oppiella nova]CAG2176445.1 unnamed protein product [Oppiella nova]
MTMNQVNLNAGKCGICGDPYNEYAKNPKTYNTYKAGSNITAQIHVVANHDGYYEFRICNATDPLHEVTQECLNQHQLEVVGTTDNKWQLPAHKNKCKMGQYDCDENWINKIPLRLPAGYNFCKETLKVLCFIILCYEGFEIIADFLHYPYVYKFGVETSEGLDLPPITICTERDVFFDKTRIVRHFNLSDDYESYKLWAKQHSNDLYDDCIKPYKSTVNDEENWIECETEDNDNSFPFAVQSLYEEMSENRYLEGQHKLSLMML